MPNFNDAYLATTSRWRSYGNQHNRPDVNRRNTFLLFLCCWTDAHQTKLQQHQAQKFTRMVLKLFGPACAAPVLAQMVIWFMLFFADPHPTHLIFIWTIRTNRRVDFWRETYFSKSSSYLTCAIKVQHFILCRHKNSHNVTVWRFLESVLSTEDFYRCKLCRKKSNFATRTMPLSFL